MKLKEKLKLNASEIRALTIELKASILSHSMRDLQAEPSDYLIASALYEIYEKLARLDESIRCFPSATDEVYSVTLTRTQALAIYCAFDIFAEQEKGLVSYEGACLSRILINVHKTYLV